MKLIIYFFLLFNFTVHAFNNDYESVNSDDKLNKPLVNIRTIYNAPDSYCAMDSPPIPHAYCGKVSVMLGKDVFKSIYLNKSTADSFNYGDAVDKNRVSDILANFHLSTDNFKAWDVPREGQLSTLQKLGLITLNKGESLWVRDTSSGNLRTVTVGGGSNNSRGKILRFVTSEIQSDCKDTQCSLFEDPYKDWYIQLRTASNFRLRWVIGYIQPNGQPYRYSGWDEHDWKIPGRATNVWLDMWHNGQTGYAAQWRNLENKHGSSAYLCAKIFGSLAVSHGELKIGKCN